LGKEISTVENWREKKKGRGTVAKKGTYVLTAKRCARKRIAQEGGFFSTRSGGVKEPTNEKEKGRLSCIFF